MPTLSGSVIVLILSFVYQIKNNRWLIGRNGEVSNVHWPQVILRRKGLSAPDGRHLFAYGVTDAERLIMKQRLRADGLSDGAMFALWAAEEIRATHRPGHLKWEWLGQKLGLSLEPHSTRQCVEQGFSFWRRPVRQTENGNRQYLYSLLAEGGLPDAYLREAVTYRNVLLKTLAEIEISHASAEAAGQILSRQAVYLPQIFHNIDDRDLLLKLVLALARLRASLPQDYPVDQAEAWLNREHPDWRDELPLRRQARPRRPVLRLVK